MVRATVARSPDAATDYHIGGMVTLSELYNELEPEGIGGWHGEGARLLGLAGRVTEEQFRSLAHNCNPFTGEQLTPRHRSDRRSGYEFTLDMPKPWSLIFAVTGDTELLAAYIRASRKTVEVVESLAHTRVRRDGQETDRHTGTLLWCDFIDISARPVNGITDPQVHTHQFVFNLTFDPVERRWKALQFRQIKDLVPELQMLFEAYAAAEFQALGWQVERVKGKWVPKGFPPGLVERFSRRTEEIERAAKARGITDPTRKGGLGAKIRSSKDASNSLEKMREEWLSRFTPSEIAALKALRKKPTTPREVSVGQAVKFAVAKVFERSAVVPALTVISEAIAFSMGKLSVAEIRREMERQELIERELDCHRLVTTKQCLAAERTLVSLVRDGRGRFLPFQDLLPALKDLTAGQRRAVHTALLSTDLVTVLEGPAGTGKTSVAKAVKEAWRKNDFRRPVLALAPTIYASRVTLRDAGFETATTVADYLVNKKLQEKHRGGLLWVDEAGLIGQRDMISLIERAKQHGTRLIAVGDRAQLRSVRRGEVLRIMRDFGGARSSELSEIVRQRGELREAVEELSKGRIREGLTRLDNLGWVNEAPDRQRHLAAAREYVLNLRLGRKALVISPTHKEGVWVTAHVRREMRQAGVLGESQRVLSLKPTMLTDIEKTQRKHYQAGDRVYLHRRWDDMERGTQLTVRFVDPFNNLVVSRGLKVRAIPLREADRFSHYRSTTTKVAPGDRIRLTQTIRLPSPTQRAFNALPGNKRKLSTELPSGSEHEVKSVTSRGVVVTMKGFRLPAKWGHLTHAYVQTAVASQSGTVDHVILVQNSNRSYATSPEQMYVSVSRAAQTVSIHTDNKARLFENAEQGLPRYLAADLVEHGKPVSLNRQRPQTPAMTPVVKPQRSLHREAELHH